MLPAEAAAAAPAPAAEDAGAGLAPAPAPPLDLSVDDGAALLGDDGKCQDERVTSCLQSCKPLAEKFSESVRGKYLAFCEKQCFLAHGCI